MTEKGLSLLCPGALVESGRIALLRLLPAAERCPSGGQCRSCRNRSATTSVFEGGGDREGPVAPCPGALVHRPGEKGAHCPSHASSPYCLEIQSRGRGLPFCEVWMCHPAGPLDVIFEGSEKCSRGDWRRRARRSEPVLGRRWPFLGEACRWGPSHASRHPSLVPSKLKVAAERCPSGAEVGTCVAPRNGCRNRSATTSVFDGGGGDREGPVAPLSWGPRAPSWAERAHCPSHASRLPRSLFLI